MKIIAIHQPNYLPWLGYFYKIYASDHFLFLDDVAYSRGSLTARTPLRKEPGSSVKAYLSVPVQKAPLGTPIRELCLDHRQDWSLQHLNRLETLYRRAPFFANYFPQVQHWMAQRVHFTSLADWNSFLIEQLCDLLGLPALRSRSSQYAVSGQSTAYLIELVQQLEGTTYHSGTGAKKYQDPASFKEAGIQLFYNDFYRFLEHHPYDQRPETWLNGLSIIDALMYIGKEGILALFRRYEQEPAAPF